MIYIALKKIVICEIRVINMFFKDKELSEMIEMQQKQTTHPEVARIIAKYGQGFDVIYFDGKADGKLDTAKNLLAEKVDEEIISKCTGISIDELKN